LAGRLLVVSSEAPEMTSINVKYLEFAEVCLDLRHVHFSKNENENNSEYIIFLNVYKAFYSNFNIVCDLSLESLCEYIYKNVIYTIDGVKQNNDILLYDRFIFNEHDKNKSVFIEFSENARIIVATTIRFDERYHQRVGGYIDFENRHFNTKEKVLSKEERAELDKTCEIKLLGYT
jgi:Nucleopolyhedrovirus protein of unknown function (DUF918)